MTPIEVVQEYFKAMQTGESAADQLIALFAEDAVYVEPFSGEPKTHDGKPAIEEHLRGSFKQSPEDLKLAVNRIDVDGDVVNSEWTCTAPVFPAPIHGTDSCTVRDGLIVRLEVSFA